MEHAGKSQAERQHGRPAAEPDSQEVPAGEFADHRAAAIAQRRLADAIHTSPRMVAQRTGAAVGGRGVVQRVGKVVADFMSGGVRLYVPEAKTDKAAYYCHGVYSKQIDPIGGVSLGYLAPHGSTTSTNPSAVALPPTHAPDVDGDGKWHSYNLTKESNAASDEAWLKLAEDSKRAIAWIQSMTTTEAMVGALTGAGYTDVLAVHCREVMGGENIDWDPVANQKVAQEGKGWLVERATLNGWFDPIEDKTVKEETTVAEGDRFYSAEKKKSYQVMNPDEGGKVRIKEISNE